MDVREIVFPKNLGEAYELLQERRNNVILGGGAYLRLGHKRIPVGIDLSKLFLDRIEIEADEVKIGAYVTLRDLETNDFLKENYDSLFSQAVADIVGIQFRNNATMGGTVFGKYGFSDLLPALLVLDAEVLLYKNGRMSLATFLKKNIRKDILTHVLFPKRKTKCVFKSVRKTHHDYALLNLAVSWQEGNIKAAVGARPQRAVLLPKLEEYLAETEKHDEMVLAKAAEMGISDVHFGNNMRGSGQYRKVLAKTLLKRALEEVFHEDRIDHKSANL